MKNFLKKSYVALTSACAVAGSALAEESSGGFTMPDTEGLISNLQGQVTGAITAVWGALEVIIPAFLVFVIARFIYRAIARWASGR